MARLTPIRVALLEQDLTQKWLAEKVGRHEATISRIVNGLHCDAALRAAIALALDRHVDELWPNEQREKAA